VKAVISDEEEGYDDAFEEAIDSVGSEII